MVHSNKIRLNVMLHDDWEIFGDGTGNPNKLMFDPAKKILDICDKYGAKYTFFAEFGQQLAMLNSSNQQHRKWANKWEMILLDAVKRGHDVQLHFHPQWIGAKFIDNRWELDYSKWALSSLEEDIIFIKLKEGKEYLENLLKPINKNYKVLAFRAGGWLNQPSRNIYSVLVKLGIKAEVSVRNGVFRDYGKVGKIDFSSTPSNIFYWYADKDNFARETTDSHEIITIPTYSKEFKGGSIPMQLIKEEPISLLYYFKVYFQNKMKKPTFSPRLLENKTKTYYCNFGMYYYKNVINLISSAIAECENEDITNIPFIMLAHSKSFYSFKNFEKILKQMHLLEKEIIIKYNTTQKIVEQLI